MRSHHAPFAAAVPPLCVVMRDRHGTDARAVRRRRDYVGETVVTLSMRACTPAELAMRLAKAQP